MRFALSLLCLPIFAGQSVTLDSMAPTGSATQSVCLSATDCMMELNWQNITYPASAVNQQPIILPGAGFRISFQPYGGGTIQIDDTRDTISGGAPCSIFPTFSAGPNNIVIRARRDSANMLFTCEWWYFDGTGHQESQVQITALGSGSAGTAQPITALSDGTLQQGFLRVFNSLVPLNSTPPVTANTGNLVEWKFDGNGNDSSGGGNNISGIGSASYVSTLGQGTPYAFIKAGNIPTWNTWANWVSLLAGGASALDGTSSFSQADASSAVTCAWSGSGPTTPTITTQTCTTTTTNIIYTNTTARSDYTLNLTVTQTGGATGSTSMEVGAVEYDANGVVTQHDPNVTAVFGPLEAYGQGPWGWKDNRHACAATGLTCTNPYPAGGGQPAFYAASWTPTLTWTTPATGTVTYTGGGSGNGSPSGVSGTTITGSIVATTTTISIADATKLPSATHLPSWFYLGSTSPGSASLEIIRVSSCTDSMTSMSCTGTTTTATLTVAYDGRGVAGSYGVTQIGGTVLGASSWSMGALIGEYRLTGSSTLFSTDSTRPLCPAGAPAPPGEIIYTTGSSGLTAGSTTVAALGGADWTSIPVGSYFYAASATHSSTPFAFWGVVTSAFNNHVVINRPYPSTADTGAFAYVFTSQRMASLGWLAVNGSTQNLLEALFGCESNTAAYLAPLHDIANYNGIAQSAKPFSYKESIGDASSFGPNFYGSGLAARSFFYISGYTPALITANQMDDYWTRSPEVGAGYIGGLPLTRGGGVLGAIADIATNTSAAITWLDVGGFVSAYADTFVTSGCNGYDSRDASIQQFPNAFAATLDPDGTRRAAAQSGLSMTTLPHLNTCARTTNPAAQDYYSFANAFAFQASATTPFLTMTNGSAAVTGSGLTSGMCRGIATATGLNLTKGSASMSGTGLVNGDDIIITGTINGSTEIYTGVFFFTQTSGTAGILSALWPGDTCTTCTGLIETNPGQLMSVIAASDTDPLVKEVQGCTFNSSSSLTLNRNWDGPSGSSYEIFSAGPGGSPTAIPGYNQQGFFIGGYGTDLNRAGAAYSGTAAGFKTLETGVGNFLSNFGYDPDTKGLWYARVMGQNLDTTGGKTPVEGACSVALHWGSPPFAARMPVCDSVEGTQLATIQASRILMAEGGLGLQQWYSLSPDNTKKNIADTAFGGIWGNCQYTAPSVSSYCDSSIPTSEDSDSSLSGFKWSGFFFGAGMFSASWQAERSTVQLTQYPATVNGPGNVFQIGLVH